MEEPTHAHESEFWDQVADWVLCAQDAKANVLSREEISGMARVRLPDGPDDPLANRS